MPEYRSVQANQTRRGIPVPTPFSFRLPRNGTVDPYFGCARTCWNELILPSPRNNFCPPVKSIKKAEPGAKRGIRLILFDSAKKYFETLAESQAMEVAQ